MQSGVDWGLMRVSLVVGPGVSLTVDWGYIKMMNPDEPPFRMMQSTPRPHPPMLGARAVKAIRASQSAGSEHGRQLFTRLAHRCARASDHRVGVGRRVLAHGPLPVSCDQQLSIGSRLAFASSSALAK